MGMRRVHGASVRRLTLVVIFCTVAGCANRVVPPEHVADPVAVYIVDYGRHSSLLLPSGQGRVSEFAYGDWEWFASNSTAWTHAIKALFFSAGATIGRRELDESRGGMAGLLSRVGAARLVRISVERSRAEALREKLKRRWDRGRETMVYNPLAELFLVRDAESYALWHNCNHETARWLRELGCSVWGLNATSDFVVKGAAAAGATTRIAAAPLSDPHGPQPQHLAQ